VSADRQPFGAHCFLGTTPRLSLTGRAQDMRGMILGDMLGAVAERPVARLSDRELHTVLKNRQGGPPLWPSVHRGQGLDLASLRPRQSRPGAVRMGAVVKPCVR
jgi:hypothetical protein